MSRSYKKSPVCTDHTSPRTRWAKRQAAKAVRRHDGIIEKGRSYRKFFCSWNICDYRFYRTKNRPFSSGKVMQDSSQDFQKKESLETGRNSTRENK